VDAISFLQSWAVARPPLVLDQSGRVSLAPMPNTTLQSRIQADLDRVSGVLLPPPVGTMHVPVLTEQVRTHSPNAARFIVDLSSLLSTRDRGDRLIEKFSWNPVSGEILFIHPPMQHKTEAGSAPFDDHVRAIILHDHQLVLFRPFWPLWVQTEGAYSVFDVAAGMVSVVAQCQAIGMLRRHGGQTWRYELNTNNLRLEALTGRRGW
jgi:hypothetical protein